MYSFIKFVTIGQRILPSGIKSRATNMLFKYRYNVIKVTGYRKIPECVVFYRILFPGTLLPGMITDIALCFMRIDSRCRRKICPLGKCVQGDTFS